MIAFALALLLSVGSAWAQDHRPDAYDGRSIPGWAFQAEASQAAGAPIWAPADGSASIDGANCNVLSNPIGLSRAQWEAELAAMTPEVMAQGFTARGTPVEPGNTVEIVTHQNRPALRHFMTGTSSGHRLDFLTVIVGNADSFTTITCTVTAGGYAGRSPLFEGFLSGLQLLSPPPA